MQGALVILLFIIVVGIILYAVDVFYYRKRDAAKGTGTASATPQEGEASASDIEGQPANAESSPHGDGCCGMHLVCEKKAVAATEPPVYYDDEELDVYAGREPQSYTSTEIEEFREVMLTLLPSDAAGWAQSLLQRRIALPEELHDELMLIITEAAGEAAVSDNQLKH